VLDGADGSFEANPVLYINLQLRKHFGMTKQELESLSDNEWAVHYAILADIRKNEAKTALPN